MTGKLVSIFLILLTVWIFISDGHTQSQAVDGEKINDWDMLEIFFPGVPIALAFLHLLLFLFYPRFKQNLYYANFTACVAILTFIINQLQSSMPPDQHVKMWRVGAVITAMAGMQLSYSLFYPKLPGQFWAFLGPAWPVCVIALGGDGVKWYFFIEPPTYVLLFILAVCAEMMRVFVVAIIKKKEGAWIVGVGFMAFILAATYQILIAFDILSGSGAETLQNSFFYGILALLISMSVYLSRNFAQTNKNLEKQLIQVRELSDKTLRLETDNARKTQELEEARKLQISMLPETPPPLPHLDIAWDMKTATEVGGDYYDFNLADDGTLILAIGDVTGHGLNAGIVVATAKGLFKTSTNDVDNLWTLKKISQGIKGMNLRRLYMALTLVRLKDTTLTIAAAGMPPTLIYRAITQSVEEIFLEGMPLGSSLGDRYKQKSLELCPGDVLLLMSDGLPEMLNPNGEMLDYPRTQTLFESVADKQPREIIAHLFKAGEAWANGRPPEDDVTFVIVKAK